MSPEHPQDVQIKTTVERFKTFFGLLIRQKEKAVLGWQHIVTLRAQGLSQACLPEPPQNGQLCNRYDDCLIHIPIPSALTITVQVGSTATNCKCQDLVLCLCHRHTLAMRVPLCLWAGQGRINRSSMSVMRGPNPMTIGSWWINTPHPSPLSRGSWRSLLSPSILSNTALNFPQ